MQNAQKPVQEPHQAPDDYTEDLDALRWVIQKATALYTAAEAHAATQGKLPSAAPLRIVLQAQGRLTALKREIAQSAEPAAAEARPKPQPRRQPQPTDSPPPAQTEPSLAAQLAQPPLPEAEMREWLKTWVPETSTDPDTPTVDDFMSVLGFKSA